MPTPAQQRLALTAWMDFHTSCGNPLPEEADLQMRSTSIGVWGWTWYGEWVRAVATLLSAELVRGLPWPLRLRIVRFAREWRRLWPHVERDIAPEDAKV